jgi:hypothetical protein
MKLKEGIKLFIDKDNIELSPNRLSLYQGSIMIEKYTLDQDILGQYHSHSFIPQPNCRSVLNIEKNILCSTNLVNYKIGKSLAVINIPEQVLSYFNFVKDVILESETSKIALALKSEESQIGILKVVNYIKKFGQSTKSIALALNLPNLITVTRQPRDNNMRYMGLHIDGWGLPYNKLQNRHLSPVKISINLGTKERYLLFINLSLKEISKMLIDSGFSNIVNTCEAWEIGSLFMKHFPDYPVVRLKILPNEAYIAPTENMIHDGSTLGCFNHDVNLQIRGYLKKIV